MKKQWLTALTACLIMVGIILTLFSIPNKADAATLTTEFYGTLWEGGTYNGINYNAGDEVWLATFTYSDEWDPLGAGKGFVDQNPVVIVSDIVTYLFNSHHELNETTHWWKQVRDDSSPWIVTDYFYSLGHGFHDGIEFSTYSNTPNTTYYASVCYSSEINHEDEHPVPYSHLPLMLARSVEISSSTPTPIHAAVWLFGSGLVGLVVLKKKRAKK